MLKHIESGRVEPMPGHLLVGRGPSASLRITDRMVSGEHASLQWRSGRWELRDLGSRNGTFVDGRRLAVGESVVLSQGTKVAFGGADSAWVLEEDGAPSALACGPDGTWLRAEDGQLALPSSGAPEVVVFCDSRGRWVQEQGDVVSAITDGTQVEAGGVPWTVRIPRTTEGTATVDIGPTVDTVKIRFAVSRDEEHVSLTVIHRGQETTLEAREHFYALLTLARARISDREEPFGEQGWVDRNRLLKMLGTDANGLNVAIYRARGQLTAIGVDGASGIVEVRRGQRRFGLEPGRIEIVGM